MRILTAALAVLLSLLIVSISVSASVCELSCSLRQAHRDCHFVNSAMAGKDDAAMSMPEGMDMGSGPSDSMTGPAMSATQPSHSMLMFPPMGMATERFDHAAQPDMGTRSMNDHSKSVSSCIHGTCRQVSASASPPTGHRSQFNSPLRVAIGVSTPGDLLVASQWTRAESPPPVILASDRLITTLRI